MHLRGEPVAGEIRRVHVPFAFDLAEADDVGRSSCGGEHASTVATYEQRNGFLRRDREALVTFKLMCRPVKVTSSPAHRRRMISADCHSLDPYRRRVKGQACLVVLVLHVACAQAELHATIDQHVDRGCLAGNQHGVTRAKRQHWSGPAPMRDYRILRQSRPTSRG